MKRISFLTGLGLLAVAAGYFSPSLQAADAADVGRSEPSARREEFRRWIKVRSAFHIVYTDAEPERVSRIVDEVDMIRSGAQSFFGRKIATTSPVLIVLPTKTSDAWKEIAATAAAKVQVYAPAGEVAELYVVNYDWETEGLEPLYSTMGRALVERLNLRGPWWFERGMGKFIGSIDFTTSGIALGQLKKTLSTEGWLPWPDFFKSPAPREAEGSGTITLQRDSQAVAFTRLALTDRDPVWFDRLLQWTALLQAGGEPTEEAFRSIFGLSWAGWEKKMAEFAAAGANPRFAFRGGLPRSAAANAALATEEMRELHLLAQILIRPDAASEAALDQLLKEGLKTELLRVLLAEACLKVRRPEMARVQLHILVGRKVSNASVYTQAASQLFNRHVPTITLQSALPSDAVVTELKALCEAAFRPAPYDMRANDLMAWTEALSPTATAAQVTAIESLYRAVYGHFSTSNISCALMVAQWRSGDKAAARVTAQVLLDSPYADKLAKGLAGEVMKAAGS